MNLYCRALPLAWVVLVVGPWAARGQTSGPAADAPVATLPTPVAPVEPAVPPTASAPSPSGAQHFGLVEFLSNRLTPYEPIYFLAGSEDPVAKFQISLRYRILNDGPGTVAAKLPPLAGLSLAYSQTSFWDLGGASSPFFDTSYRPEFGVAYDDVVAPAKLGADPATGRLGWAGLTHVGLHAGVQHESNGRDGLDSRSMNFAYVRPILTFGNRDRDGLFLTLGPRVHAYLGELGDNPDVEKFRGYTDLRVVVGQGGGLQAAFIGRVGSGWDKGSCQMDVTFPLRGPFGGNVDLYLDAQVFTGFGESLVDYNESDTTFRLGVALVR